MQLMHVAEISSTKSNVTVVTTCHKMTGMSGTNQQSTKLEVRPVNLTWVGSPCSITTASDDAKQILGWTLSPSIPSSSYRRYNAGCMMCDTSGVEWNGMRGAMRWRFSSAGCRVVVKLQYLWRLPGEATRRNDEGPMSPILTSTPCNDTPRD